MLSVLQLQNTVIPGSEEMQRRSAQVKVVMDLNSLYLPSPASSLLVPCPKPGLLFFGHSPCDTVLDMKNCLQPFFAAVSILNYYITHILLMLLRQTLILLYKLFQICFFPFPNLRNRDK